MKLFNGKIYILQWGNNEYIPNNTAITFIKQNSPEMQEDIYKHADNRK